MRGHFFEEAGKVLEYPDAHPALVEHAIKLGLHREGSPVSYSELHAYKELTRAILSPGQAEAIIAASREFCAAVRQYDEKPYPPPTGDQQHYHDRIAEVAAAGFRQMVRSSDA